MNAKFYIVYVLTVNAYFIYISKLYLVAIFKKNLKQYKILLHKIIHKILYCFCF